MSKNIYCRIGHHRKRKLEASYSMEYYTAITKNAEIKVLLGGFDDYMYTLLVEFKTGIAESSGMYMLSFSKHCNCQI